MIRSADELTFRSDLLREEIRKAKLTQHDIAKALKITDKTFSKKMNGDSDWTLREIQQIQAILKDIDIGLVFGLKKVG